MKQVVGALAFLTSLVSLLLIAGGGVALFAIENSGERGSGALLALGGAVAFGAVMALLFTKEGTFAGTARRAMAIAAAIIGAIPVGVLSFGAIRFAGLPVGSSTPTMDWSVLLTGIVLGFGTLAILALGHRRSQERTKDEDVAAEAPVVVHMQQIRHAQQQLRSAFAADQPRGTDDVDEDVRVRRV